MHVLELFDLSGQVAIVTGAARGLGRQAALALAEAGADVALCDLLAKEGEQTRTEIESLGRRSLFALADITQPQQIEAFVARAIEQLGKVDILVNNAGMGAPGFSWKTQTWNSGGGPSRPTCPECSTSRNR